MYEPLALEDAEFVTILEAADMCGVSRRTVAAWASAGNLVTVFTPEGRCFRRSAIEAVLEMVGGDDYPLE